MLDAEGRPDFSALQRSFGGRSGERVSIESIPMVFDLLYLDGHDLTGSDLTVRRHLLEGLIAPGGEGAIRRLQAVDADPVQLIERICEIGLNGIIAKRLDRPYRSGRNGDWLKIRYVQSEGFMIVGYEVSATARGGIGSLLLAGRRGIDWIHVGAVGTGFTRDGAIQLRALLDKMRTKGLRPRLLLIEVRAELVSRCLEAFMSGGGACLMPARSPLVPA